MISIAVINPPRKGDYLANTIFDGLGSLVSDNSIEFRSSGVCQEYPWTKKHVLLRDDFILWARKADIIFLTCRGTHDVDLKLAERVSCWDKTVFIDGSEFGGNDRFDKDIIKAIEEGRHQGKGAIHKDILEKSALYFRREKPYVDGIIPLPYAIESSFIKYSPGKTKKDIDFVCIFGQDQYPPMRKEVREYLEQFCKKEGFLCRTKQTNFLFLDIYTDYARKRFYKILARAKVGISIGGAGFDTRRFWEILANNCLLLTEKIDIYRPGSNRFPYKRIHEFSDLSDFSQELEKVARYLRSDYNQQDLHEEYRRILREHSSRARVMEILEQAQKKGIISPKKLQ